MIGNKVIESKPISLVEVHEMLKARKKEKELTYEQDRTLKCAKVFTKLNAEKSGKLLKELKKIEGMDAALAVKIVDVLPTEKEVMGLLVSKDAKVDEGVLTQALELVGKYYKKKEKKEESKEKKASGKKGKKGKKKKK